MLASTLVRVMNFLLQRKVSPLRSARAVQYGNVAFGTELGNVFQLFCCV